MYTLAYITKEREVAIIKENRTSRLKSRVIEFFFSVNSPPAIPLITRALLEKSGEKKEKIRCL